MPGSENRIVRPATSSTEFTGEELLMTRTFDALATVASREGHRGGWDSTFDRLTQYLMTENHA